MAYFAALLARTGSGWVVSDSDLDEIDNLDDLADTMRKVSADEEPVLLFVEQEDLWFAIVRVDGEDDPRVFVSDAAAAARSSYGDMLLADAGAAPVTGDGYEEGDGPGMYRSAEPVGDSGILSDLGTDPDDLLDLSGEALPPTDALTALAARAGCADQLESVR